MKTWFSVLIIKYNYLCGLLGFPSDVLVSKILLLGCISLVQKDKVHFLFGVVHELNLIEFKGRVSPIFKDRSRGGDAVQEENTFSGKLNNF